jgi:hypothetical protein
MLVGPLYVVGHTPYKSGIISIMFGESFPRPIASSPNLFNLALA